MFILKRKDGSYICPVGFKNNFLNAYRFKTYKEAKKFAKDRREEGYEVKEIFT